MEIKKTAVPSYLTVLVIGLLVYRIEAIRKAELALLRPLIKSLFKKEWDDFNKYLEENPTDATAVSNYFKAKEKKEQSLKLILAAIERTVILGIIGGSVNKASGGSFKDGSVWILSLVIGIAGTWVITRNPLLDLYSSWDDYEIPVTPPQQPPEPPAEYQPWLYTATYYVGAIVQHNSKVWRAKVTNQGVEPGVDPETNTYWEFVRSL